MAEGGDMYEQQKSFRDLIAGFTDEKVKDSIGKINCGVIELDGTLPEVYHSLLHNALKEYADGTDTEYDMSCAKEYAKYMIEQIKARI